VRLALLSPVAPQRSAISDYTEELLPFLRRHAEVDVWVDGVTPTHEVVLDHPWFDFGADRALLGRLGAYDGVICHMGNDARFHAGIHDVIRSTPSVVVLHDTALSHFFHSLSVIRQDNWLYLDEMDRQHGRAERDAAEEALCNGWPLPHHTDSLRLPMIQGVVEAAAGVVVHAAWSKDRIDALGTGVPIRHIPPLVECRTSPSTGSGGGPVRFATFGLVTPEKGIERTMRVLASLADRLDFEYWVVGDPHPSLDVRALAEHHGIADRTTVTGHISMAEFLWRIEQVDVAINLRERTSGETSSSMLRIMGAGVATVVSDVGAFSEVPDGCVAKVAHGPHQDVVLEATLLELALRPVFRRALARAGWEHVRRNHRADDVARAYVRFVEEVSTARARRLVTAAVRVGTSAADIASTDGLVDDLVPTPVARFVAPDREAAAGHPGRLAPPAGVDWRAGATGYAGRLADDERAYLSTKPYYDLARPPAGHDGHGVDVETHRHLIDAADVAAILRLPAGSRILDAACGPGWLSEHLARFGYRVTGADVSAELVALAAARIAALPHDVAPGVPVDARFVVHDLEGEPLAERFDAVVIYDALHHVPDERAAVAHLAAMVAPGGVLYVVEGDRPPPGSAGEAELQAVMIEHDTLESPFDHAQLRALVEATGLVVIGDYVAPGGLVDRSEVHDGRIAAPQGGYHRLLAKRVLAPVAGTSADGADGLRATWAVGAAVPLEVQAGEPVVVPLRVTNAGSRVWLADQATRRGVVSVAPTIDGAPAPWRVLPRAIGPLEHLDLEIELGIVEEGTHRVRVDLVAGGVTWFGDAGSEVLELVVRAT
jgi:2-polyprenyl-3-methyl-5-hydroxy-6-metoxy-1,4-benzoquinol methylase/glycosyltransferase involved in cell wall biosynthesis